MDKRIQAPRGTHDLLGDELTRLEALERLAANTAKLWGYTGIRTPVFEHTGLFTRSIGEATDIVEKEMFTIPRRTEKPGADSFTLRPENTAGVVRAYLEHNLHKTQGLAKLCYVGPQFRRERPQKGRLREFNQMGAEVLGIKRGESGANYTAYAEVMLLAAEILARAGLKGLKLKFNSVGCSREGCRDGYRERLKDALTARRNNLCGDCQRRTDRNVFRVLDCKKPNCREICASFIDSERQRSEPAFCKACVAQLMYVISTFQALRSQTVQQTVQLTYNPTPDPNLAGTVFELTDPDLVRGLDYYTGTVFEFTAEGLGSQDAVGGGGSYDGLIEELGGPSLGATGFALGLERILIAQRAAGVDSDSVQIPEVGPLVYVAAAERAQPLSASEIATCYRIAVGLRQEQVPVEYDLSGRSLKAQMKQADKLNARLAVIIGEDEIKHEEATLKDMQTGEQKPVKQVDLAAEIRKVIGS